VSLNKNILANYIGQSLTAIMGIAFIPTYIKYLGNESYGLIGILLLFQNWLSLFDVGMTPTLNREVALFTGGKYSIEYIYDLLRTIEIITFSIAIMIFLNILIFSKWLASNWLKIENLPIEIVQHIFIFIGIIISLKLIENIYRSCITGFQKQVMLNIITSLIAILRNGGAVIILLWVSNSIEVFFLWNTIVSLLSVICLLFATYKELPVSKRKSKFSLLAIKNIWQFAGGMLTISSLALILTQFDKILLSKILTLEEFGYYSLATTITGTLYLIVTPISQAFLPEFNRLVANHDYKKLYLIYHQGSLLVTSLLGGAAIILILFSNTIIHLWTTNELLSNNISTLVSLLALGNLLNGLMFMPYQVQLAHGWTTHTIKTNFYAALIATPLIFWTTPLYGATGAAIIWIILNIGFLSISVHFMHKKILIGEKWKWYWYDITIPLIFIIFIGAFLKKLQPIYLTRLQEFFYLSIIVLFIAFTCLFVIKKPYKIIKQKTFNHYGYFTKN
jgi:O-antigen/teichoic acid export membrane protein